MVSAPQRERQGLRVDDWLVDQPKRVLLQRPFMMLVAVPTSL